MEIIDIDGIVSEIIYDRLPDSSGSVSYWIARYDGKDYIICTSASSSEYKSLNIVKNKKLEKINDSIIINFNEFMIYGKTVSETEYNNYVNSIEYPSGMSIDGLK